MSVYVHFNQSLLKVKKRRDQGISHDLELSGYARQVRGIDMLEELIHFLDLVEFGQANASFGQIGV